MSWIRGIAAELFGLFVDDASYALTLALWIVAVWLLLPWLALPPPWPALLFFSGLGAILVESAYRRARTDRRAIAR